MTAYVIGKITLTAATTLIGLVLTVILGLFAFPGLDVTAAGRFTLVWVTALGCSRPYRCTGRIVANRDETDGCSQSAGNLPFKVIGQDYHLSSQDAKLAPYPRGGQGRVYFARIQGDRGHSGRGRVHFARGGLCQLVEFHHRELHQLRRRQQQQHRDRQHRVGRRQHRHLGRRLRRHERPGDRG
jgi:hypothetical protein